MDSTTAVIVGGGGHIGSAAAKFLARLGVRVAVVDVAADKAKAVTWEITVAGGDARACAADVSDESAVESTFAELASELGHVDALVNCAAPLHLLREERPVADMPVAIWDEILAITLRGTMLCTRQVLPLMTAQGHGAIVNVSSIHADAGDTGMVAYPAAKAAVVALSRSVATQYGRDGVRCNVVSPGAVPAPGTAPTDIAGRLRHQAIARVGQAEDIAYAIAFLLSDQAAFITGQVLTVDGGVLMHLPSFADGGNVPPPTSL